jgi:hypothetical protein
LTVLNLERAVFDVVGGLRTPGTPNDTAYGVLFLITYFAVLAFVPLGSAYLVLVWLSRRERRDRRAGPATAAGPTP